jgi:ribosomal protein S18 acetylase RimI-like enzyme
VSDGFTARERAGVEAVMRARDDGAADRVEDLGWGSVVLTPSVPLVWDMNHVRVEDPATDPDLAVAEAERRGLPKVLWEHAVFGGPPRGRPTREVVMLHRRSPDDPEAGAEVVALGDRERDAVLRAVLMDDPDREPFVDQMVEAHRRWYRAVETVALGVRAPDGTLAGQAWLYRHGGVAQIEDVNVLSAHRGRGLGRALIAGGLTHVRRHELVFIVADANDWPQQLYGKLGFEPVWHRGSALLVPGRVEG